MPIRPPGIVPTPNGCRTPFASDNNGWLENERSVK
jgi:hypothetical protein